MELDAEMASPKRSLRCGSNLQVGLVVLTDECGTSWSMTKFGQQLSQVVEGLNCCKAKGDVLGFKSRFSHSRLQLISELITSGPQVFYN